MLNHATTHGVQFDVTLTRQQVVFLLGQTRSKAPFPQRAATTVGVVYVLDVALSQSFYQGAKRFGAFG